MKNNKFKVTFILTDPTMKIVGGYKMVYIYSNYLTQVGCDVCILYRKYSKRRDKILENGYTLYKYLISKCPIKWFKLNKNISRKMVRDLKEADKILESSEVIITTAAPTMMEIHDKYIRYEGKTIHFIQDFENWDYSEEDIYNLYSYNNKKIVISKWLKDIVDTYSPSKSVYIPNGIDCEVFKCNTPMYKRENHSIAMLYHTQERKGIHIALKVLKKLLVKYPDLKVYMFGSPKKPTNLGFDFEYYQNATPEKVSEIYNRCQVFLCSSLIEGFGLTGLESMLCGCVLVSTPCKGVLEYAINGVNSIIANGYGHDELAKLIDQIFSDKIKREEYSKKAVELSKVFSQELSNKKFAQFVMR